MFHPNYTQIPPDIIGKLCPLLISSVPEIINARIDQSTTGANFLIIPFNEPKQNFAILVEISHERLSVIKNRAMKLIFPFQQPEKKLFYLAQLNKDKQIEKLAFLYPEQRKFEWPISTNLDFDLNPIEKPQKFSLLEHSQKINQCSIEIIFEADVLKEDLPIWTIKAFLFPFVDLIKSAILSGNIHLNLRRPDARPTLKLRNIEHKCLRSILEFDLNPHLSAENEILKNIENVHLLLDADIKEEMLTTAGGFENKNVVPDAIRVFRSVISHNAILKSQLATPEQEFKQIILNRADAQKRKRWLDTVSSSEPYTIKVSGSLTCLDFERKIAPLFTLHTTDGDEKYCGKIAPPLLKKMDDKHYNFRNTEYECLVEVVYTPESLASPEKYEYTLLNIQ